MWSLTLVWSLFCLTVPISLAVSFHSYKMCGENSVRKWVQRSCWAERRVTPIQKHWEITSCTIFKLHKTSVEPGQASYSLVSTVVFRCLRNLVSLHDRVQCCKDRSWSGIKIPALIRTRKDCCLCLLQTRWKFSAYSGVRVYFFWFIWAGTCVLTDEHLKEVYGLS